MDYFLFSCYFLFCLLNFNLFNYLQVSTGEGKNPLFKDYDEINRKEKIAEAIKLKVQKEEIKKKKKSVNFQKNKMMAPRMETQLMNNPKLINSSSLKVLSTQASILEANTKEEGGGCCTWLTECLGLSSKPRK